VSVIPIDLQFWSGTEWVSVPEYAYNRDAITITRQRRTGSALPDMTSAQLSLNNTDGRWTLRNPNSPYRGLIGRNTPMRVSVGSVPHGSGTVRETSSGTHTAPSVTATSAHALLLCSWLSVGAAGGYAVPGGMTAGTETDNSVSTMRSAVKALAATGATGTQSATFTGATHAHTAVAMVIYGDGADPTVREQLSGNDGGSSLMTLGSGTLASDLIVAVQGWESDPDDIADPPWDSVGDWQLLVDTLTADANIPRTRVWARWARRDGAQAIAFPSAPSAGHGHLYVLAGAAGWTFRAAGSVPSWPVHWVAAGADIWASIEITGVTSRLDRDTAPARSALRLAIEAREQAEGGLVAYWPLEDGPQSEQAESLVDGVGAMAGLFSWTSVEGPGGSAPVLSLANAPGWLYGDLPVLTGVADWSVTWVGRTPSTDWGTEGPTVFRIAGMGGLYRIIVDVDVSTGYYRAGYQILHDDAVSYISTVTLVDTEWHFFRLRVATAGGTTEVYLHRDEEEIGYLSFGVSADMARFVEIFSSVDVAAETRQQVGHLAIWTGNTGYTSLWEAAYGHVGETALDRMYRVLTAAGFGIHQVGSSSDTMTMGPQPVATVSAIVSECVDADLGLLYEHRGMPGTLVYRTRASIYQQPPILTLQYDASTPQLHALSAIPDDDQLVNDMTVTREQGSSARYVLESGPLSVLPPPEGVGRADDATTVNVELDTQLYPLAGWFVYLGTRDEERYPITLNLGHMLANGLTSLATLAQRLDFGDRLVITDPPVWLAPGSVDQLFHGSDEQLTSMTHELSIDGRPASPYDVAVIEDTVYGRLDSLDSYLLSDLTSSATSVTLRVVGTSETVTRWSTTAEPYDWRIGDEVVTCTAMTTVTPTFIGGGTAMHADGASVTPTIHASSVQNDLMLLIAACRNSGTGRPITPSGWERLEIFARADNVQVFARVHSGTESAPTVEFANVSAGVTCSARVFTLRGVQPQVITASTLLNASAQNIAYPAHTATLRANLSVFVLGWKQDDWTSVATLAGMSEAAEISTTTGDDQALVLDFVLQTTPANVAAGSFVVTGGAAAISRSATFALAGDVQTGTVTRSVNGVTQAHSAGDAVSLAYPMRLGL